jgi:hypothetical protein
VQYSIEESSGKAQLKNDANAPGNDKVYGTNGSGTKGWGPGLPSGTADGQIAVWDQTNSKWITPTVGTLANKDMIRWDSTNKKFVKVTPAHSVEVDASDNLHLMGDVASPGNYKVFGTDGSGNRAWLDTVLLS